MRGHKHIVDFLLKKTRAYVEVDANPKLNPKEKQKFEDVQKALLRKTNLAIQWEDQVEIDEQRINDGFSGVFFAIRAGDPGIINVLRSYGANFDLECMSESKQKMRPV